MGTLLTAGDVYCGVGGMSLGFEQAGFDVRFGIDMDPLHVETYSLNFPKAITLSADVTDLSGDVIREVAGLHGRPLDVLFGGPPCQGFSIIGRRQIHDPRNNQLKQFARLVFELQPRYFVVENVEGLLRGLPRGIVAAFLSAIRTNGYVIVLPIRSLDASDFGVPQRRRRVFILGYRRGEKAPAYPIPLMSADGDVKRPTVWEFIGDLARIRNGSSPAHDVYTGRLGAASRFTLCLRGEARDALDHSARDVANHSGLSGCKRTRHSEAVVARFKATRPGTYEPVSRYYRLTKDGLAPTLRSGSDEAHGSYTAPRPIHPTQARCITVREAARLQTFPDWFQFHPTQWHGHEQIGNAVPPRLALFVAACVARAADGF
jgi:DNA (cytosine-5)-methyltransferase 1